MYHLSNSNMCVSQLLIPYLRMIESKSETKLDRHRSGVPLVPINGIEEWMGVVT